MQGLARIVGVLSIAATLAAQTSFFAGATGEPPMKAILLVATIAWFTAAPFWLKGGQ